MEERISTRKGVCCRVLKPNGPWREGRPRARHRIVPGSQPEAHAPYCRPAARPAHEMGRAEEWVLDAADIREATAGRLLCQPTTAHSHRRPGISTTAYISDPPVYLDSFSEAIHQAAVDRVFRGLRLQEDLGVGGGKGGGRITDEESATSIAGKWYLGLVNRQGRRGIEGVRPPPFTFSVSNGCPMSVTTMPPIVPAHMSRAIL